MSDRDRIHALAEDGRITSEEADRLIATLDEIDGVQREFDQVDSEIQAATSTFHDDEPGPAPRGKTAAREPGPPTSPNGSGWVVIEMLAGEVKVDVDPAASEPALKGDEDVKLERDGDNYRISQFGEASGGILERIVGGFRRSSMKLTIPEGFGLDLRMKAGEVRVRGEIPFLRGNVLAGEVKVDAVRGVDFSLSAGELHLGLRAREGHHKIRTSAGEVNLTLLAGSSVRVDGRSSIGDVRVDAPLEKRAQGIGQDFSGQVGDGAAELTVRVSAGEVNVKVEDE